MLPRPMLPRPVIRPRPHAARPLLPVLALCLALCFGLAGAGRAATLVVTTVADSGTGSLRAALATSSADGDGDVITFDPTVFAARQTIPLTNALVANAGVTIQGPAAGVVLDGSGSGQSGLLFESDSATSAVSNLTLQNFGGTGLSNRYGTLTATHCVMQGNTAQGGGVFNDGTMTLIGCTVANNTTSHAGAGLFSYGTLTLTGCTVSGNISGNYGSGGIEAGAVTTLTDCTVTNNVSNGDGGGAIASINGGILTVTNCTFTGNQSTAYNGAYGGGGAIALVLGTTTLTNDIFYGDSSPQGGGDEIFYNAGQGGGTLTVNNCDIASTAVFGGAYTGGGNLSADPLFVSAPAGNFHLLPGSPALGAGTPSGAPATDKDGNVRPAPPSIGAYDAGDLALLAFPGSVPGGTVVTATVTLSAPAPAATVVGLSSSNSALVRLFRAVVIPAGSSSATFLVNTYRSHTTSTVTITATLGQSVQAQTLTITGR